MQQVKTTPIKSLDSDKLELELLINQLKAKKEYMEKEMNTQIEATDKLNQRYIDLQHNIQELYKVIDTVTEDIKELKVKYSEYIQLIDNTAINFNLYLKNIDNYLSKTQQDLDNKKSEYKQVHNKIVNETEQLIINKNDLDIYKKRLEKKCAELYPSMKIII